MITWAVNSALAVSLMIALVLLVRRPVAHLFGARAAYALWAAPLVRALMPRLPVESFSIARGSPLGVPHYRLVVGDVATSDSWSWSTSLLAIWLIGAAAFLAFQLWRHHRFVASALARGRPLDIAGVPYDVVASEAVEGPLATGLVHPLILVPVDFAQRFNPEQQRLALLHEQLHHRRGDIWASAAALVVTGLLWFNPLAHLASGAFRRDMEAACDARLLAEIGTASAPAYAETILRSATRPVPRSLCALTAIDELKGRLRMLTLKHGKARRVVGLTAATILTIGAVATAGSAHDPASGDTKTFEKKIEIREIHGDKDVIVKHEGKELAGLGENCPGEKFVAGAAGGTANKKEDVKFILCTGKGERLLPALEKAEADFAKRDDVPNSHKQEILAKIRARIAELRAKG